MNNFKNKNAFLFLIFCILSSTLFVHSSLWTKSQFLLKMEKEDIYYAFLEGNRLINNDNPYQYVLSGDMRNNDKYATYFPLFYILSGITQLAGLHDFYYWLFFWRFIFLICLIATAYLIFNTLAEKDMLLCGIFGALFWLFNRWTLQVTFISHIDFIPIFFLILSLSLINKRFSLACILFGLSLAVKQIAIFALPLYLIWSWQKSSDNRIKNTIKQLLLISTIPLIVSIPFLIWNAEGFIKSILFSATRFSMGHFEAISLETIFGLYGIPAKIPMFFLFGLIYTISLRQKLPPYTSVFLIMITFILFNSVLFNQYMVWFIPLIPLMIGELNNDTKK